MEQEAARLAAEIDDRWQKVIEDVTEIPVIPTKSNIFVEVFGVAWAPYYRTEGTDPAVELPAWE